MNRGHVAQTEVCHGHGIPGFLILRGSLKLYFHAVFAIVNDGVFLLLLKRNKLEFLVRRSSEFVEIGGAAEYKCQEECPHYHPGGGERSESFLHKIHILLQGALLEEIDQGQV